MSRSRASREYQAKKQAEWLAKNKPRTGVRSDPSVFYHEPDGQRYRLTGPGMIEARRYLTARNHADLLRLDTEIAVKWFGQSLLELRRQFHPKAISQMLTQELERYWAAIGSEPKLDPSDPVSIYDSFLYWEKWKADNMGLDLSSVPEMMKAPYWFGTIIDDLGEGDYKTLLDRGAETVFTAEGYGPLFQIMDNGQIGAFLITGGNSFKVDGVKLDCIVWSRDCWLQFFSLERKNGKPHITVTDGNPYNVDSKKVMIAAESVAASIGLLNTHGGYRYANDPAEHRAAIAAPINGMVAANEPPRLRIVYVNEVETIRPQYPLEAVATGTGSPKSPHDRSPTEGWRWRGKRGTPERERVWVKIAGAKIHGGAPQPVISVVRLANPLTGNLS
jgi:hypothetical protein